MATRSGREYLLHKAEGKQRNNKVKETGKRTVTSATCAGIIYVSQQVTILQCLKERR